MNDNKVVSLEFARRARTEQIVAPAASKSVPPAMAFTPYEIDLLTRAFQVGKEAGVLHRIEMKQDDFIGHFNMFTPTYQMPSIYVSREREGKWIKYKCWTTYNSHQTIGEGNDFGSFLPSVRYAVNAMVEHVSKINRPKP